MGLVGLPSPNKSTKTDRTPGSTAIALELRRTARSIFRNPRLNVNSKSTAGSSLWRSFGQLTSLVLGVVLVLVTPALAIAGQYEFLAAPQINLSLMYRLDRVTGEVIACQFAHNPGRTDVGPGAFGITSCYRSGDGATKQEPGEYGLVATRHEQEGGVFRVDYRTGGVSVCYLYFQREKQGDHEAIADQYVVCTPQWKQ